MDDKITQDYYADKSIQDFYLKLWGGDSIHIGIYHDDYIYSADKDKTIKISEIRASANSKKN